MARITKKQQEKAVVIRELTRFLTEQGLGQNAVHKVIVYADALVKIGA